MSCTSNDEALACDKSQAAAAQRQPAVVQAARKRVGTSKQRPMPQVYNPAGHPPCQLSPAQPSPARPPTSTVAGSRRCLRVPAGAGQGAGGASRGVALNASWRSVPASRRCLMQAFTMGGALRGRDGLGGSVGGRDGLANQMQLATEARMLGHNCKQSIRRTPWFCCAVIQLCQQRAPPGPSPGIKPSPPPASQPQN